MRFCFYTIVAPVFVFSFQSSAQSADTISFAPRLIWVDKLEGDFSFANTWSYAEGIYKNEFGQLDCDGICPPEIDFLKDKNGKIKPDKLREFYKIIDTAHHYHSLLCESTCSEFAGADYITVVRREDNSWAAKSHASIATHCMLHMEYSMNIFSANVTLVSIMPDGDAHYDCTGGQIKIENQAWENGYMKATFYLSFVNSIDPAEAIIWKGLIYVPLKQ